MSRALLTSAILIVTALGWSVASAEELPESILKYFPGKWISSGGPDGDGSVEWQLVADGKAVAGPGMTANGGADFGLGGWQAKEKKWVHAWFQSDGGYGRTEVTRYENSTYFGKTRTVNGSGVVTSGEFQVKVIDNGHFKLSVITDEKVTSRWQRVE